MGKININKKINIQFYSKSSSTDLKKAHHNKYKLNLS